MISVHPPQLNSPTDEKGEDMPTSGSSNSDTAAQLKKTVTDVPSSIVPGRKTVFMDSVPPETTEEALRTVIDPFGERLSSKFSKDSHGNVRCAVVKFKSPQQATNFISCFNGRTWPGSQQTVKAQLANQEERETDPERDRIFVTNLPTSARADDLMALFSQFGTVTEIDPFMAKDGSGMGSATVRFATIEQATAALEKVHNKVMFPEDGRRVVVKFWEPHGDREKHKREQQMRQQQPVMSESGHGPNAAPRQPMTAVSGQGVNADQLRRQNGDIALYGTPITQSALVQILTLQYGPVMYCIPITEISGGHAVRMQDMSLHQRIAAELNGALLSNGCHLRSGIIVIE